MKIWIQKDTSAAALFLYEEKPAAADQFPSEFKEIDLPKDIVADFFDVRREWRRVQKILSDAFYKRDSV